MSTNTDTPIRPNVDNVSQLSNTPRSVLTDPDDDELQSANALLQLSSQDEELNQVDQAVDNELILPVGIAPVEDFTKNIKTLIKTITSRKIQTCMIVKVTATKL